MWWVMRRVVRCFAVTGERTFKRWGRGTRSIVRWWVMWKANRKCWGRRRPSWRVVVMDLVVCDDKKPLDMSLIGVRGAHFHLWWWVMRMVVVVMVLVLIPSRKRQGRESSLDETGERVLILVVFVVTVIVVMVLVFLVPVLMMMAFDELNVHLHIVSLGISRGDGDVTSNRAFRPYCNQVGGRAHIEGEIGVVVLEIVVI